ncbi:hypothetical protein, partial [Anaplasma marginale]|uniref:hypothetical protein n=1 Tax=Anaplasma marginale TaxID=770 RepID=UPI0005B39151
FKTEVKEIQGKLKEKKDENKELIKKVDKLNIDNAKHSDMENYLLFCLKTCLKLLSKTKLTKYNEIITQYKSLNKEAPHR